MYIFVCLFVFQYEKSMENEAYIINLLIILGKFHIHRCKFTNQKPFFFCAIDRIRELYGFH